LIGNPKAQCFLVLWGPGGNGKGTLVKILEYIFGSYCTPLENRVLLDSGKNDHKTELNIIRHKRLATVAEMPKNEKWNESILKKLTGEDQIHARGMRENASSFISEAAIIIHCNEMPSFSKITPAILRRFRMVGTLNTPETVIPRFDEMIIRTEASAILWKCMKYANAVLRNDFILPNLPESMESQRTQVLSRNDKFFGWVQAECELRPNDENSFEKLEDLKTRYEMWLARISKDESGMVADKIQISTFKRLLIERGIRTDTDTGEPIRRKFIKGNGIAVYESCAIGVKLRVRAVA
jgi:putative DNA primase/helicase